MIMKSGFRCLSDFQYENVPSLKGLWRKNPSLVFLTSLLSSAHELRTTLLRRRSNVMCRLGTYNRVLSKTERKTLESTPEE